MPWTLHLFAVVGGFALGLLLVLRLIQQRQRPSVTLAWLLAMVLLPYVAVPLYLLLSGRKLRARVADKAPPLRGSAETAEKGFHRLLLGEGCAAARGGNELELLLDGGAAYERVFGLLESARRSIHVSTFLLARDGVGERLVQTLAAKAREGLDVRLLVDALGCFPTRGRFLDPLRAAGGAVGVFLPVTPLHRHWSANLRNHRKIAVVDGSTGWTGGMNFALEYMGPGADEGRWVDASMLVRGPAVRDLGRLFADDWEFTTGERLPVPEDGSAAAGEERVQVLASGPDVPGEPLADAILALTARARRRIAVVTPYFVPDEPLQRALLVQARMGTEVLVLVPERSNHRLADVARGRFLQELAAAGASVRLVPGRMVHAKLLLFDDEVAMFGSANLDLRSLYLNFEVSLFLDQGRAVRELSGWVRALAATAVPLSPVEPRVASRLLADASALIAPLL